MSPVFKKIITIIILFFTLVTTKTLIAAPPVQDSIIGLYTAYYKRAPDQEGFDFWNQQASATGDISATLLMISEGFSQHPQFIQDYPSSDTTRQFVTKIYNNILNRAPDAEGLDFWVTALDNGLLKSKFIVTYLNAVLSYSETHPEGIKSKQMFSNKVTIGQCFIDALGTASNGEPNSLAYTRSIDVLSEVTEENTSMELAFNKIKSYLPANTALPRSCQSSEESLGVDSTTLDIIGTWKVSDPERNTSDWNPTVFIKNDMSCTFEHLGGYTGTCTVLLEATYLFFTADNSQFSGKVDGTTSYFCIDGKYDDGSSATNCWRKK